MTAGLVPVGFIAIRAAHPDPQAAVEIDRSGGDEDLVCVVGIGASSIASARPMPRAALTIERGV
jgi:hypothetical protein